MSVPDEVRTVAGSRRIELVWQNEVHGLTFRCVGAADAVFVKWAPAGSGLQLADETARLRWAAPWTPVPRVLDSGSSGAGDWLVTAALDGVSAVDAPWSDRPAVAVTAIGEGLRAFHEALPVEQCPFSWSVDVRVAEAHRRTAAGRQEPHRWHAENKHLSPDEALRVLAEPPAVDRLVVCHGDACSPNTLVAADGSWAGHVDLGSLGVADRWADLAIATWSADWNYGPGWQDRLLDAYGIDAGDEERTSYYRLLWDLT